ncbi:tetraacyldisaccharide 4'-kinase [Colwellia sp. UCD-KL20]|uniref:tetraacyldisaccharide 4'-kinase n=1 Tax=Colwellia sp. UCD-KL20 TaxID=1917165 RepID=UPI000970BCC3|nr:tetraacyldisaccharide 4'-kinase [Colwellia sp. UCD-KL20]
MRLIEKVWFKKHQAKWLVVPLLLPITLLFFILTSLRRFFYQIGLLKACKVSAPIIIVGNIGIGGNGKTPVVIFLIEQCLKLGLNVGVVSRGYGGKAPHYPYLLDKKSTADEAGDEPILIYKRCQIPVVVGSDRVAAARLLIEQGCNIIIADDGLQHYKLARDIELIIVDAKRKFGNGLLLPAGPLREGAWRLNTVDYVIFNQPSVPEKLQKGQLVMNNRLNCLDMVLCPQFVCNVKTREKISLQLFIKQYKKVNAMAGIGDPERFFTTLRNQKFEVENALGFVDHHHFTENDLNHFPSSIPLLMTEKDAVKCQAFAKAHWWYVPVGAEFSEQEITPLLDKIRALTSKTDNVNN